MKSVILRFAVFLLAFVSVFSFDVFEALASWNLKNFVVSGDVASGDAFGTSVDVSGDWAIIGANGKVSKAGAAYVFKKDTTGSFIQYKKLVASDVLVANDNFGFSVAIDGDYAAIGAFGKSANIGAVYIFSRNQGGENAWGQVKKVTVTGGIKLDYFGRAVDLDGDNLVATAFGADGKKGAAYIFSRNQGGENNWGLVKKLVASDGVVNDYLGDSVGISGDNVVVGSYRDNSSAGSAYLFSKNQGGESNWGQVKRLVASDTAASTYFGYSVDIEGEDVVVGAQRVNSKKGAVYVFSKNQGGEGNYGQMKKIVATDTVANDLFGSSVYLDGGTLAVGAIGKLSTAGAAYIFGKDTGGVANWGQVVKLPADGLLASDSFGIDVGLDGGYVVVGVNGSDKIISNGGGANVYLYNNLPSVLALSGAQRVEDAKVQINYQIEDLDGGSPNINSFEYSINSGGTWAKLEADVFSDDNAGTAVYDYCLLFPGQTASLSLRAKAHDGLEAGDFYVSPDTIYVDCTAPILYGLTASQVSSSDDIIFTYGLSEYSNNFSIVIEISDDGGLTWTVPSTSVSGAVGTDLSLGLDKNITWKAGVDFPGQEQTDMLFRLKATDKFGNTSDYFVSELFSLDTKAPGFTGTATLSAAATVNVVLNWDAIEEANFGYYEIWYGKDAAQVDAKSAASVLWNVEDDKDLDIAETASTFIPGLDYGTMYYFNIWAFDNFGHESLVSNVSMTTPSQPYLTHTVYEEKKIYIYPESDTVEVSEDGVVTTPKSKILEVPTKVDVVDGVFHVPEDFASSSSEVFEIKDVAHNLSLFIPRDAEITIEGKDKFFGSILQPMIETGAPLVSEDISNDILLTINAETSADGSVYFSKPVIVTFELDKIFGDKPFDSKDLLVYFYDKSNEEYDYVSDLAVSLDGKTAAFLTYHFSTFVVMKDAVVDSPLVNDDVPFDDLGGHWVQDYVGELYGKGVVNGKGYRQFAPYDPITRAEFLKMILMTFEYEIPEAGELGFNDLSHEHWAYDLIGAAKMSALITGYEDGTFKPDEKISRAEAMKILIEASKLMGDSSKYMDESEFDDVDVSEWYLPYLNFAFVNEVAAGYGNGKFGPQDDLKRAEAAKLLVKMLQLKTS